ncbi:MAG: hypothetical protein ABF381_06400 [Akkermansiaceae bacterium]
MTRILGQPALDTGGFSLVLKTLETNPTPSNPANWRASFAVGGSPGENDSSRFLGDSFADLDSDSLSSLLKDARGSSDLDANSVT